MIVLMSISSAAHLGGVALSGVEDLTRFGFLLVGAPIAVVAGGVLLGMIGRWLSGRRDG